MQSLAGRKAVVIGASRGVGRRVVEVLDEAGAYVLAVARDEAGLRALAEARPRIEALALDAREPDAPGRAFDRLAPDMVVVTAGVFPPTGPLHELSWDQFAVNWESDAKIAFNVFKAALARPLAPGATVVLVSSGAALGGSPNSGGYAPAKRAQLFMVNYAQKEADRLGLDLRFLAIAPRIMPDTDLGQRAIASYARYLGVTEADFVNGMTSPPSADDAAHAVINLLTKPPAGDSRVFVVTGDGLQVAPA